MSEQSNNNSSGNHPSGAPQKRHHNNRRRHHNRPPNQAGNNNAEPRANAGSQQAQGSQNSQQNQQNQKRRPHHHHNRPRPNHAPQSQGGGGFNIERIYEKYLNLLDQHIIARRKYHDLFYRADGAQKNKLERNFYNTLNDIREFESKLAPDVRVLFEKRNNGYQYDRTYTSNHELPVEGDQVPENLPPAEPHLLQSQIAADYSHDTEESVGGAEDYIKYKNL